MEIKIGKDNDLEVIRIFDDNKNQIYTIHLNQINKQKIGIHLYPHLKEIDIEHLFDYNIKKELHIWTKDK